MACNEISDEINRLKLKFEGADENRIEALEGLIEQAAYERVYLRRLNEQAIVSGLVEFNPKNPKMQRTLPVSGEIAKHAASYSNIMNKLMKYLGADQEEDDEGLSDYE